MNALLFFALLASTATYSEAIDCYVCSSATSGGVETGNEGCMDDLTTQSSETGCDFCMSATSTTTFGDVTTTAIVRSCVTTEEASAIGLESAGCIDSGENEYCVCDTNGCDPTPSSSSGGTGDLECYVCTYASAAGVETGDSGCSDDPTSQETSTGCDFCSTTSTSVSVAGISTSSFTRACTTTAEASSFGLDSEGCTDSNDVTFCICESDLCNTGSGSAAVAAGVAVILCSLIASLQNI